MEVLVDESRVVQARRELAHAIARSRRMRRVYGLDVGSLVSTNSSIGNVSGIAGVTR